MLSEKVLSNSKIVLPIKMKMTGHGAHLLHNTQIKQTHKLKPDIVGHFPLTIKQTFSQTLQISPNSKTNESFMKPFK